jgi:hypothetical protein
MAAGWVVDGCGVVVGGCGGGLLVAAGWQWKQYNHGCPLPRDIIALTYHTST